MDDRVLLEARVAPYGLGQLWARVVGPPEYAGWVLSYTADGRGSVWALYQQPRARGSR